ncbi:signal peptidase I [Nematocida homosporus]|uniref:signal peptidase I n=1 Tax=Nematocida homosporus TaxID=1912981 RepID=UPI0022206BD2|nr:signal peptidase I [Nematocida homosporus]KAI5184771.1 signal peptidase I [Nematocida homosporus]
MKLGTLLGHLPFASLIFSPTDLEYYNTVKIRTLLLQLVNASYLICSAYMLWKGIGVLCNTDSPVVVVLSESMYPGFHRGDILLLANWKKTERAGDICVFQLKKNEIPVVHRIIDKHYGIRGPEALRITTKGDNNSTDDMFLYTAAGRYYLVRDDIKNYVYASFPLVGLMTIWANAWPGLKYVIIGILFLDVLFSRDENATGANAAQKKKVEGDKEQDKDKDKKKD